MDAGYVPSPCAFRSPAPVQPQLVQYKPRMNAMHTNMKNRIIMMAFALSAAVASAATITVDDFANHNTQANSNNLSLTKTENDLTLTFGVLGTSNSGWDAFGTGTSTFGQSGAWFDAQYVKFGNSGNQQLLDFRITNNTGSDVKLTNISFDILKQPEIPILRGGSSCIWPRAIQL